MSFKMLTLYARREPAALRPYLSCGLCDDDLLHADRVLYRDASATKMVGIYPWHRASGPNKRSKSVMFNCWRYELVWLEDLRFDSLQSLQKHPLFQAPTPGFPSLHRVTDQKGSSGLIALFH